MRIRALLILSFLLLASFSASASASNDAASGDDAPDTRGTALTVGEGTHAGAMDRSNDVDWYRFEVPAGKVLKLQFVTSTAAGYLRLYDGPSEWSFDYVYAGETQLFRPPSGVALIQVGTWNAFTYSVTLRLQDAPPQNDGGSGGDAPDYYDRAWPFHGQVLRGELHGDIGERSDWYRIEAAADEFVRVVARSGAVGIEFRDPSGSPLGAFGAWPGSRGSAVPVDGVILVGLLSSFHVVYEVEIQRVKRADLSVGEVATTTRPLETEAADAPTGIHRDVQITLHNGGPGATSSGRLVVYTLATTYGERRVHADVPISLAAGETLVKRVEWRTHGQVGDVTLHVEVFTDHDADGTNNAVALRTYNLVGGTGFGADAAPYQVR